MLINFDFAEFDMSKRSGVNIQIDCIHSRAICDEIADRLRIILRRETSELPAYLKYLVERLAESDDEVILSATPSWVAPSIIPSLEDMMVRLETITPPQEDAPELADLAD
jgi:hypothetical protein